MMDHDVITALTRFQLLLVTLDIVSIIGRLWFYTTIGLFPQNPFQEQCQYAYRKSPLHAAKEQKAQIFQHDPVSIPTWPWTSAFPRQAVSLICLDGVLDEEGFFRQLR
ncbi:MAG: hypothetical protein ACYCX4_10055 [Bacillota bacterium]